MREVHMSAISKSVPQIKWLQNKHVSPLKPLSMDTYLVCPITNRATNHCIIFLHRASIICIFPPCAHIVSILNVFASSWLPHNRRWRKYRTIAQWDITFKLQLLHSLLFYFCLQTVRNDTIVCIFTCNKWACRYFTDRFLLQQMTNINILCVSEVWCVKTEQCTAMYLYRVSVYTFQGQ
jgi:hypothetical protein